MTLTVTPLPTTFTQSVARVTAFALDQFEREIASQQLRYHNLEHINGVQQRANRIFQAVRPYWNATPEYLNRMKLLLDLSAVTHDTIQIFVPPSEPHTPRRRESGVSEAATIKHLDDYIQHLNWQLLALDPHHPAMFTTSDRKILQEAIRATVCAYDPAEQAIYQPDLYDCDRSLSYVARILALADIGALGMDGIASYNQEGSLLFLEENPDIIPLIQHPLISTLKADRPDLYENLRQRLLRRARFQVNFARSRLFRLEQELEGLPTDAFPILKQQVFQHLNPTTIQDLESTTPIAVDTPLSVLLAFFQFEGFLQQTLQV